MIAITNAKMATLMNENGAPSCRNPQIFSMKNRGSFTRHSLHSHSLHSHSSVRSEAWTPNDAWFTCDVARTRRLETALSWSPIVSIDVARRMCVRAFAFCVSVSADGWRMSRHKRYRFRVPIVNESGITTRLCPTLCARDLAPARALVACAVVGAEPAFAHEVSCSYTTRAPRRRVQ